MTSLGSLIHPAIFPWLCLAAGLCAGSFLNVVIYRLPRIMERDWQVQCAELRGEEPPKQETFNLALPRSRCPACAHPISALQNIPIASYLALRGKCSACGTRISPRYPLIEGLSGLAGAYAAWHFGFGLAAFAAMLFLWCMIALSFIDFDTQLLPDSITLPLLWAGLLLNLGGTFVDLGSAVIGAAAGYLALWSVYWGFKIATGKEGMGFGDFKLLAAVGAWLGWQMLPLVVLASSFVGAVFGISLMLIAKHGRNVPIPFGPYLAVAGVIALFWGKPLTYAYLKLL
jgi:leader peptidase (prepilin peptidase) / N-methyltransferase